MKRILTTILVLPFALGILATDARADNTFEYGWTISRSHTDAYANTGPFTPGLKSLYLWYACNSDLGLSAAQFGIDILNPANILLAFTPKSGFLNAGGSKDLLLAVGGCPDAQPNQGPINAGIILMLNNAPGGVGLRPSDGLKVSVDCGVAPEIWPIQWIGYSDDGTPQLGKDWDKCVKPVSVEEESWGQIKSIYR